MIRFQHGSQGPAMSQVSSPGIKAVHSLGSLLGLEKGVKGRKEKGRSSHELLTGEARSPGRTNGSHPRDIADRSLICFSFGPFQQPCEVLRVEYIRKLRQALSKFREEEGEEMCCRACLDNPIFPKGCVLTPAHPMCLLNSLQTYPNFLSYT